METSFIERSHDAFQQPLSTEQIMAICAHTFGSAVQVTSVHELSGGTVNNTYALDFSGMPKIVLRVAPAADNPECFRHEGRMLRREWAVQPFLAPIAQLVPRILTADFSQQIVARDYMFQSYMPGVLWRDIHATLTADEQHALWRQLGHIARQIHSVQGESFGIPDPVAPFSRWSDAVLAGINDTLLDMAARQLSTSDLYAVFAQASLHRDCFDQIGAPRLLHGDLWLNNLLVEQHAGSVKIVGVLDSGFARWGDPLADWTIMRMMLAPIAGSEAFWKTYGEINRSSAASFRLLVYQAWSAAISLLELRRMRLPQYLPETSAMLRTTMEALLALENAD